MRVSARRKKVVQKRIRKKRKRKQKRIKKKNRFTKASRNADTNLLIEAKMASTDRSQ